MQKIITTIIKLQNTKKIKQGLQILTVSAFAFLFIAYSNPNATEINTTSQQEKILTSQQIEPNKVKQIAIELTELIVGNPSTNEPGGVEYLGGLIGLMYDNPPASTSQYAKFIAQKLSPPPAYAQETEGYTVLSPLLELWKSSVSAALFLATIVFIVIGFMVMFRKKINTQTVATVQGSLPAVVMALIIMYLSYAIVGAILDFSNIVTNTSLSLFAKDRVTNMQQVRQMGIFESFHFMPILRGVADNINSAITSSTKVDDEGSAKLGFMGLSADKEKEEGIFTIAAREFSKTFVGIVAGALGIIGALVIAVVLLTTVFRVFFALLTAYASIIIYTILGPLQIILGGIPGQSRFITGWFKEVLANALIFPAIFTLLIFAAIIGGVTTDPWNINLPIKAVEWNPPLLSLQGVKLNALIALGLILLAPKVPETIKKALGAEGFAGSAASSAFSNIPFIGPYAKSER